MTLDEFKLLAETWGGDIERWPVQAQDAARDVAASVEGTAFLETQRRLDCMLAVPPDVGADRAKRASFAVLQRIAQDQQQARIVPWYRRLLPRARLLPAASLACSAILGFWLALSAPYQPQQDAVAVVDMVFDSGSAVSMWVLQ